MSGGAADGRDHSTSGGCPTEILDQEGTLKVRRLKVVLDTNVVVSIIVNPDDPAVQIGSSRFGRIG